MVTWHKNKNKNTNTNIMVSPVSPLSLYLLSFRLFYSDECDQGLEKFKFRAFNGYMMLTAVPNASNRIHPSLNAEQKSTRSL